MTQHVAASQDDARLAAWIPTPGSADNDLIDENAVMMPRARDLVRNNPMGSAAIQTLKDNIIGSQLRLSALPKYRLLGWDKDQASEWASQTEDEFATWAETTECDAARTQTLLGLTLQSLAGALMNGDALALVMWLKRKDGRWSTRLQTVEADRLATPPWLTSKGNVRGGVEIDKHGAPVAYWIRKTHPGDHLNLGMLSANQNDWERVTAFDSSGRRNVIHLYDKERSGQSRGKTIFAAVMREFHMAGEYMGTELHAALANALIATFVESSLSGEQVAELFGQDIKSATNYYQQISEKYNKKKMESGLFVTLPLGTTVKDSTSGRPNTAFDGFMESIMRHMAAGLNMPYELLVKDFSKTNYSSARAALLEAWRYFQSRRRWLQDHWLSPIYQIWMEEAVNLGRIEAADFYDNLYAYTCSNWVFSGRGFVDPVKEPKGSEIKMAIGLSTQQDECAEQGKDYQDVQDQRVRELQEASRRVDEVGLPPEAAYYIAGFIPSKVQLEAEPLNEDEREGRDPGADENEGDDNLRQDENEQNT